MSSPNESYVPQLGAPIKDIIDLNDLLINLQNTLSKMGWFEFAASAISAISSILSIGGVIVKLFPKNFNNLFDDILKSIQEDSKPFNKLMNEIGKNIVQGLIQGIAKNKSDLMQTIRDCLAEPVKEEPKKILGVNSPSRVMIEIGRFIAEGLGLGIGDNAKYAIKAMDEMGDGVKDASKSLSKIGDGAKDYTKSLDDVGDATEKVNKKKISFGGVFTVAASVLATIVGLFTSLMDSNDGFREKVEEVWGKIQEAFQPVVDIVTNFFAGFVTGSEETGGAMDTIMSIVSGASDFICAIIQWISDFWAQNGEAIMAGIQAIWDFLQPIVEGIMTFVGGRKL